MKIIYAYESDAANTNVMSGYPCSILSRLEQLGHDVIRVFPLRQHPRYRFAPKYLWYRRRGLIYRPDREPAYLRSLARQIERRVADLDADLLVAPGSHVVAALETPHPKVFIADATFANVLDFYDSFDDCAPEFVRQGHALDQAALDRCAAAFYPSEWAARSAIEHYGASPGKIHVIPWGANVDPPDKDAARASIQARPRDRLRVLFLGRDWYRKGGDTVLAACAEARRRNVPVELDLIGLVEIPVALPAWARSHGLLDKTKPEQKSTFERLLANAHTLFVPSRAENYGMMFCEAAAFGVPSLSTAIGGITGAIRSGETGITLPAGAPSEAFADVLQTLFEQHDLYNSLALASLEDYHTRLNWDVFTTHFLSVCEEIVASRRAP